LVQVLCHPSTALPVKYCPAVSNCDNVTGPLEQGYIRPSENPYSAPGLFGFKKDGGWRSSVDARVVKSYFLYLPEHINRLGVVLSAPGERRNSVVHCPRNLPYQVDWIPALSEGGFSEVALFLLKASHVPLSCLLTFYSG
jgi:hypothetical protein